MNVNEILGKALSLLGITDLTVAAGNADPRQARLVNALGVAYQQLITEYAPLETEESIVISGGSLSLGSLSNALFDVVKLIDETGAPVPCRISGGTLVAANGSYRLRYYYLPQAQPSIGGTVAVAPQVTLSLFARGVAAEYAFESMLYEEALLHERKYKEGLMRVLSPHGEKRLTVRRWI